jgi:DNA-binding GntR family transcriptional regulator
MTPPSAPHRTKQEFVYRTIRGAILRCDMRPGERLVIEDLAQRLDVSTIPVREALQLLQSEGLVQNIPHVGATVSPISRESIDEVFTVMEGLEIVATRGAAERMTPEDAELGGGGGHGRGRGGQSTRSGPPQHRFTCRSARLSAMPLLQEIPSGQARWDRVRRYYFSGSWCTGSAGPGRHRELYTAMKDRRSGSWRNRQEAQPGRPRRLHGTCTHPVE